MKTLSIVAITAFAFLGLANFASAQEFQVSSTTFMDGGILPISAISNSLRITRTATNPQGIYLNSCSPDGARGGDRSPELSWTNVPPGTTSFAVIAYDREADAVIWGMYNILGTARSLPENAGVVESPYGLQTLNNGRLGYRGPCPAATNAPAVPHLIVFTVYALRQPLTEAQLPLNSTGTALAEALLAIGSCSPSLPCANITGSWPSIP